MFNEMSARRMTDPPARMSAMPGPLPNTEALREFVEEMQALGTDHQRVEAKRSRSDIPHDLWKAVSAFSNTQGQGGGTIVLGVDERKGFTVTGVEDVAVIQDKVRSLAHDMQPRPQLHMQAHNLDGKNVVEVFVPEVPDADKPCFKSTVGRENGSFKRVGDSNEKMNDAELRALDLIRGPARDDELPVEGASIADLDADLVDRFLAQRRAHHDRYADMADEEVLRRSHVLTRDGKVTVAGLIAMGEEPGYFHPGLKVQFVAWATDREGASDESGLRYVDNPPMFDGPLPDVFRQLLGRLKRNLRTGSRIDTFRTDVPEYPDIALREALINALVHRSLHPTSLNSYVTVSVFPSRIEIVNPGGLYQVGLDEDGRPAGRSTRNTRLMEILEHLPLSKDEGMVVENRGGGIPAIVEEIRKAGLQQPRFLNQIYQFTVRFPRGSLVAQETLTWLSKEAPADLTVSQRLGAAMLHQGEELTNEAYRTATGVDSVLATRELAGLVDCQLAQPEGERRGRKYRLHAKHLAAGPSADGTKSHQAPDGIDGISDADSIRARRQARIVAILEADPELRTEDLARRTAVSIPTIERDLRELRRAGRIGRRRPGRRRRQ